MTDKRSEEMVISDLMEAIQGWRDRTCGHNWNWHRPAYDSDTIESGLIDIGFDDEGDHPVMVTLPNGGTVSLATFKLLGV